MSFLGSRFFTRECHQWTGSCVIGLIAFLLVPTLCPAESTSATKGLPLTRFYPFDDIGDVSRGAQLSFDAAGRLAVVHDGAYLVLNDNVWLDLAAREPNGIKVQRVQRDTDGTCYYISHGSWGVLTTTEHGQLRADPLVPVDCPKWARTTAFTEILCQPDGIYFAGPNGVAYRDRSKGRTTFIEIPASGRAFAISGHVYISSHSRGMLELDLSQGKFRESDRQIFGDHVIDKFAMLDDQRAIMSTTGRRLLLYENNRLKPLGGPLGDQPGGPIALLKTLSDGNVAVAITGRGLYLITPDGNIVTALTHADYRSISSLATNEAGVLWAATETGVAKILYGAPVTVFGQAVGLPIGWPQIVLWDNQTIVASNGRLYEPAPAKAGEPIQFQLMPGQPAGGTWGIANWRDWLLVANAEGVYTRRPGQRFERVLSGFNVSRLAMLGPEICLVIGNGEITALRCEDGIWRECAPRVPSIGFPSIVHSSDHAVWIEIGANRAGHIALTAGKLQVQVFESFPWREPRWIHISIVGDTAILSGPEGGRVFLDEKTGEPSENPLLAGMLEQAPYWIARVRQDATGRLWASHAHGVFTLTPGPAGYVSDTETYRVISEHIPMVQALPSGDIWMSTGQSLYHADTSQPSSLSPLFKPRLVSVRDLRTNRELIDSANRSTSALQLSYRENSLALRFFAGSYASRRTPDYEFRLNDANWTSLDATSLLRLSDLRDGAYQLVVRLVDTRGPIGEETMFNFSITPPWYRTWSAFSAYALLGLAAVFGLVRLFLYRSRARNATLERTVAQRTEELKVAMEKLRQETRTAATLAERNRLAGEIHDSLEQGFSGLLLQLDTTVGLGECPPQIQRALSVARNMVTFSRNEVRHAVWDLHSPMLDTDDLGTALKHLIAQSVPDPARASISIRGASRPLGSTVEHHLLRIAQEAIANAVKHALAERLEIELEYTDEAVRLRIRDNGRGFDPQKVISDPQGGHFGLRSLRGRAAKIGASIEIKSEPGAGTQISVYLPLLGPHPI